MLAHGSYGGGGDLGGRVGYAYCPTPRKIKFEVYYNGSYNSYFVAFEQ